MFQRHGSGLLLILDGLRESITQLIHMWNSSIANEEQNDGALIKAERLFQHVVLLQDLYRDADFDGIKTTLNEIIIKLNQCEPNKNSGFTLSTKLSGNRGAPKFHVAKNHLEYLLENNFTTTQIANMLNISVRTVKRRMKEFGLSIRSMYTAIGDEDLDKIVENYLKDFPNTGYKRMKGFLTSNHLRVQEIRVRECMRRVDPEGVILRALQSRAVIRRKYRVKGPLSLWHMDGNHKLIA